MCKELCVPLAHRWTRTALPIHSKWNVARFAAHPQHGQKGSVSSPGGHRSFPPSCPWPKIGRCKRSSLVQTWKNQLGWNPVNLVQVLNLNVYKWNPFPKPEDPEDWLHVVSRIPACVEDDHSVCCHQVDSQAPCPGRDKKESHLFVGRSIEVAAPLFPSFNVGWPVHAEIVLPMHPGAEESAL